MLDEARIDPRSLKRGVGDMNCRSEIKMKRNEREVGAI